MLLEAPFGDIMVWLEPFFYPIIGGVAVGFAQALSAQSRRFLSNHNISRELHINCSVGTGQGCRDGPLSAAVNRG